MGGGAWAGEDGSRCTSEPAAGRGGGGSPAARQRGREIPQSSSRLESDATLPGPTVTCGATIITLADSSVHTAVLCTRPSCVHRLVVRCGEG